MAETERRERERERERDHKGIMSNVKSKNNEKQSNAREDEKGEQHTKAGTKELRGRETTETNHLIPQLKQPLFLC